jgi:hypothetical protein
MTKFALLMIGAAALAFAGLALFQTPAANAADPGASKIDKVLEARLDAEMAAELRRLIAAGAADAMCPVDGHGAATYSSAIPASEPSGTNLTDESAWFRRFLR